MDPLSVIASVIAISEASGAGVKTLKGLANASSEFSDMLGELSALEAWLDQLRLATDSPATTEFQISANLLKRLELAKVELSQIVNEMENIRRKLIKNGKEKVELNKKGEVKISVVTWPRVRGRVQKLRDRTKRCREELSACLDVVGLMQQLQQQQTSREILNVSNTQFLLMQATFTRLEERFNTLQATLTRQAQDPEAIDSSSDNDTKLAETGSRGQPSRMNKEPWVTDIQIPVRQKCSRYCKCQCHRSSAIRNPSWSHALLGSMMIQYNGTVRLDTNPCDIPGCQSDKGRKIWMAYSFPSWLIQRAFQLSANWGSLTDMGASLHLTVPRVCQPLSIFDALHCDDVKWLQTAIDEQLIMPRDITNQGEPYLLYAYRMKSFRCVDILLQAGFNPSFPDQRSGMSLAVSARRALLLRGHPIAREWGRLGAESATEQTEDSEISTLIRDALLGVGSITLEDAIASEAPNINGLDDVGWAPLHWAAAQGTPSQIGLLLRHGADINIQESYLKRTPLHIALNSRNTPCVEFLLSEGSNLESRDLHGLGALHFCPSSDVMRMLLSRLQDTRFLEAKSLWLRRTALHSVIDECAASELVTILVRAGADLEAVDRDGMTAFHIAISLDLVETCKQLHRLGARFDWVDNSGRNILLYTAARANVRMMSLLRSIAVEGIGPDHESLGVFSAMDLFKERMEEAWQPGQTRPTQRDVFSFYALITEIRDRNWERGLFLETRERLEVAGQLKSIRTWLGAQWQALWGDEEYGDSVWDFKKHYYPEDYPCEEIDIDYDVGILFGDNDQSPGHFEGATTRLTPDNEQDGDLDEFFDALE